MKCDVVRDLLPLYIDGLASEVSRQEVEAHLIECEECRTVYDRMKTSIEKPDTDGNNKEINYLKKIKNKNMKNIIMCIAVMLIIFGVITALFAVGTSVKKEDMSYTYRLEDDTLWIDFKLNDGKDLLMRTETNSSINNSKEIVGITRILTPCEVMNNPLDDVGKSFSLGSDVSDIKELTENKVIIQFEEKEVVIDLKEALNEINDIEE